jgi:hypothetical protein
MACSILLSPSPPVFSFLTPGRPLLLIQTVAFDLTQGLYKTKTNFKYILNDTDVFHLKTTETGKSEATKCKERCARTWRHS